MVPTGKRPQSDAAPIVAGAAPPIALTVAGSDSGGGAGIQADLKTFHQFGVYGTSAITATTAQNTRGVLDVHVVPTPHVVAQLEALASDLPPASLKSGMLASATTAAALADAIERFRWSSYVLDPVMVATSGDRLLDPAAEEVIRTRLMPLCTLITPNTHEAAVLTGTSIESADDAMRAGQTLIDMGAKAVLMKGGHLQSTQGEPLTDALITQDGIVEIRHPRIETTDTHGTGCTLAAAVTALLANGDNLDAAVRTSIRYVTRGILTAPGLGSGNGPLNHFAPIED